MSTKKELRFDPGILDSMSEPLSVRVEKIRGGNRMPIDLPPRDADMAPGVGWDKDSVRRLETWLINDWSGGGLYNITVVDTTGRKMEWQAIYDPREFPERIPPTMQASTVQPAMQRTAVQQAQPQQIQQPQQAQTGAYGVWPPPGHAFGYANIQPQAQQVPQQQMQPPPQATGPIPMPWWNQQPQSYPPQMNPYYNPFAGIPGGFNGSNNGNGQSNGQNNNGQNNNGNNGNNNNRTTLLDEHLLSRRRARLDDDDNVEKLEKKQLEQKAKDLEEQLRRTEREKLEQQYKAELEKTQKEAERQLETLKVAQQQRDEALKEELRRMREAATAVPPPNLPNPELEQLKEERAKIERERERILQEQKEERYRLDQERKQDDLRKENERRSVELKHESEKRFAALEALLVKLSEQPKGPTGPDPVLVQMQEQMRIQQADLKAEREERARDEKDRREKETFREEIRRQEEAAKRREELLTTQINDLKQAQINNSNKGPDPIITMIQESNRQQAETFKEMMREQKSSADRMQTFMMSPRDILSVAKESSTGLDELKRGVVDIYKDVFETQRMLIEQAAQLNTGGESPTMRLMEEGIKRAGDLADRYFKSKSSEVVAQGKVQEAHIAAQAQQAQIYAVQQARMAEMAKREEGLRAASAQQAHQAQAQRSNGLNGNGLNGAAPSVATVVTATGPITTGEDLPKKKKKNGVVKKDPLLEDVPSQIVTPPKSLVTDIVDGGNTDPQTGQTIAKIIPLRRLGKTDEEWFGDALSHVKSLRSAVDEFIKSIKSEPPKVDPATGEIVGASPEQCIDFLIRAVNYILSQGVKVPAISDLFMQDRFAELLDILIPDAPQGYKDDCVRILYLMAEEAQKEASGESATEEEEEDDDEDEDGEDDE